MVYRATIMSKGHRGVVQVIHKATMKELKAEAVKPLKDPTLFAHFYRCRNIGSPSRVFMGAMRA